MLDYLKQFNDLPDNIKNSITNQGTVTSIKNLENKYKINLAPIIMRIMIKEIQPAKFIETFTTKLNLSLAQARELANDLQYSIFFGVKNYIYGQDGSYDLPTEALAPKQIVSKPIPAQKNEPITPVNQATKIMTEVGLSFPAAELNLRFENIINTYLKGIRNRIVTKESLIKAIENGGLGMSEDQATDVLDSADGKPFKPKIEPKPSIMDLIELESKKNKQIASRDVDYDFSELVANKNQAKQPVLLQTTGRAILESRTDDEMVKPVKAALPTLRPTPTSSDIVGIAQVKMPKFEAKPLGHSLSESLAAIKDEEEKEEAIKEKNSLTDIQNASVGSANWQKTDSGKVVMADVLSKPHVYSPIDELRFMTIKNFRNLSKDPEQAINFVLKKIEAVITDDFSKKVEAITAWKQSPINRMYLDVCKVGLMEAKPAAKVLSEKQKEDVDFLSNAEFEAIIKLNKILNTL